MVLMNEIRYQNNLAFGVETMTDGKLVKFICLKLLDLVILLGKYEFWKWNISASSWPILIYTHYGNENIEKFWSWTKGWSRKVPEYISFLSRRPKLFEIFCRFRLASRRFTPIAPLLSVLFPKGYQIEYVKVTACFLKLDVNIWFT